MTRVLAVDLAASMSALVVIDAAESFPHYEGNSFLSSELEFCEFVALLADREQPDVIAIEDLPHGLAFAGIVKAVCRMQGRIVDRIDAVGLLARVLFVPPAAWQRPMGCSKPAKFQGKWDGKETARQVAENLGYVPPDLLSIHAASIQKPDTAKLRPQLRKLATDHVDAFLIAKWMLGHYELNGSFDAPTTQRYER